MLVISHRGAKALEPENTIASLKAGIKSRADIVECDVRVTKDNIPVLFHNATLLKYRQPRLVSRATLEELRAYTKKTAPIATFEEALHTCFGKVLFNIELKSQGSGKKCLEVLERKFIKKQEDWNNIFFSSFLPSELKAVRKHNKQVSLSLLHSVNPFIFIAYQKKLNLSAVGFHHLHVNRFALKVAEQAGLFTYVYTVNRPGVAKELAKEGFGGVVTNFPNKMVPSLKDV